jgi:hypothetical protein
MDLRENINFRDIRTLLNLTWVTTQASHRSARQQRNDPKVRNLPGSAKEKIFPANWILAGRKRLDHTLIGVSVEEPFDAECFQLPKFGVFRMKKTIVITLAFLTGIAAYVGPRNAWNGIRVANDVVRGTLGMYVSDDYRLKMARKQLEDEKIMLEKSLRTKAQLATKLDNQKMEVNALATKLKRGEKAMLVLRSQLPESGRTRLVSTSDSQTAVELTARLTRYKSDKEVLAAKERQAKELETQLTVLNKGMEDRRVKLELLGNELTKMESQLESMKLRNGGASLPSQDGIRDLESQLGAVRESLQVEERLQIELEAMEDASFERGSSAITTSLDTADALEQFDALFGCSESNESL